MDGRRLSKLRVYKGLTLGELGERVGRSASTISRYENNTIVKWNPDLIAKIAKVLDVSPAYLMGMTDDPNFIFDGDINSYIEEDEYDEEESSFNIIIADDDMSPEIPYGAFVKIRPIIPNEKIQFGNFYYIEFNSKRCFRMAIEDYTDGIGFLPNSVSERRIAYDPLYVKVIGKAVSMKVIFEDQIEYDRY